MTLIMEIGSTISVRTIKGGSHSPARSGRGLTMSILKQKIRKAKEAAKAVRAALRPAVSIAAVTTMLVNAHSHPARARARVKTHMVGTRSEAIRKARVKARAEKEEKEKDSLLVLCTILLVTLALTRWPKINLFSHPSLLSIIPLTDGINQIGKARTYGIKGSDHWER